jgi:hypothetical protein
MQTNNMLIDFRQSLLKAILKGQVSSDWVRIDPPLPLVCRKRQMNGAVLWMRLEKQIPVSQQVWHDKDPTLLKGPERQS